MKNKPKPYRERKVYRRKTQATPTYTFSHKTKFGGGGSGVTLSGLLSSMGFVPPKRTRQKVI